MNDILKFSRYIPYRGTRKIDRHADDLEHFISRKRKTGLTQIF